jgi:hypothetical protein
MGDATFVYNPPWGVQWVIQCLRATHRGNTLGDAVCVCNPPWWVQWGMQCLWKPTLGALFNNASNSLPQSTQTLGD